MINFDVYKPLVENAMNTLGLTIREVQSHQSVQWRFLRGNIETIMLLRESKTHRGTKGLLVVFAPLVFIPKDQDKANHLFQTLLKLNHSALIESFCISGNIVLLKASRFVEGMEEKEIMQMVDNLSYSANLVLTKLEKGFKKEDNPTMEVGEDFMGEMAPRDEYPNS